MSEEPSIVFDLDSPEWTAADFAAARPASEIHGSDFAALFVRKPGRPPIAPEARKRSTTLRLSPDVLDALRAGGPGWQTRADAILRKALLG
jgi:uncharacterized protein (DUF4415 family)